MTLSSNEPRLSRGRFSRSAILLLSSLFALGTVACSSDADDDPQGGQGGQGGQVEPGPDAGGDDAQPDVDAGPALARIEVTPAEASIVEARTVQLSAKGFDEDDAELEEVEFSWASSDEKLATVDAAGLVTGRRPGEVKITASAGGKSAEASITITASTVTSFELQADTTDVPIDGKVQLHAIAKDAEGFALLRDIAFESADEAIAIVEDSAAIGINLGETKITAKLDAFEDSIDVRVVHRFAKLFAGLSNTCGLTAAGRAWCWGYADALGDGSYLPSNAVAPVRVAMKPGIAFQSLTLGTNFGCGLTTDEKVYCWGSNADLVLGREDDELWSSEPLLLDDRSYKAISAMGYGVCGLDDGGFAHCWGGNGEDYELGNPDVTENSAAPIAVSAPVGEASPVAFTELRHGDYSSCGLTPAGKLFCWGYNNNFQLGDGTEESRANAVAPLGDQVVKRFDLGRGFGCAITSGGFFVLESGPPPPEEETTHCWGENMSGQAIFGNSSFAIETPTVRFQASDFVPASFALGTSHACALDGDGRAFCWGSNLVSQLGRSTATTTADIGEVEGGLRFTQLVSGSYHACGLATDGKTYCWGFNGSGQLGTGDLKDAEEPKAVAGQ